MRLERPAGFLGADGAFVRQPITAIGLRHELADPDAGVRKDAFEFALKRTKGVGLEPLSAALAGKTTVDAALKAGQVAADREMKKAGYYK